MGFEGMSQIRFHLRFAKLNVQNTSVDDTLKMAAKNVLPRSIAFELKIFGDSIRIR